MQAYHEIKEKLRHPGCALDLKEKKFDWTSVSFFDQFDQLDRLVCCLVLH